MKYKIRKMEEREYPLLFDYLYEAIFIPDGVQPPERNIINLPELQVYVIDFGKKDDDKRMLSELKQRGREKASLSVQKASYAARMYLNVGFKILCEHADEYIMVCDLRKQI